MRALCLVSFVLLAIGLTGVSSRLNDDVNPSFDAAIRGLMEIANQCPRSPGCCEEDCCGQGSSYDFDAKICVPDVDSEGFNGTYSETFDKGCIERGCCEEACCSAGLVYDADQAFCLPDAEMPSPNDKLIGEQCSEDSNCVANSCFKPFGGPMGVCTCNVESGEGCEGDSFCGSPSETILDAPPMCLLPLEAECGEPDDLPCESGECDPLTKKCSCNYSTNWPCDTEVGERCLLDENGSYECRVTAPIGGECRNDSECDTGACQLFSPDSPGTCSCNLETNAGCSGDLTCQSLFESQGINTRGCYLQYADPCDPLDNKCVTGNCADETKQCTCNDSTNWPCNTAIGEVCILDAENSFACIVPQIGNGKMGTSCLDGSDCETNSCYYGNGQSTGTCVCNPATGSGCTGDYQCASVDDIREAQGIVDVPPKCLLPYDAECSSSSECLSAACDGETGLCACSSFSNYPCDMSAGERCLMQNGSYICIVPP